MHTLFFFNDKSVYRENHGLFTRASLPGQLLSTMDDSDDDSRIIALNWFFPNKPAGMWNAYLSAMSSFNEPTLSLKNDLETLSEPRTWLFLPYLLKARSLRRYRGRWDSHWSCRGSCWYSSQPFPTKKVHWVKVGRLWGPNIRESGRTLNHFEKVSNLGILVTGGHEHAFSTNADIGMNQLQLYFAQTLWKLTRTSGFVLKSRGGVIIEQSSLEEES